MEQVGKRIKRLLHEKGLTQKELAGMIGVTECAISRYLSGKREPRLEVASKLAVALGITLGSLISGTRVIKEFECTAEGEKQAFACFAEMKKQGMNVDIYRPHRYCYYYQIVELLN